MYLCYNFNNEDYVYRVDIRFNDFFDFMKPYDFEEWKSEGKYAYERACRDLWGSDWFSLHELEEDKYFIDFMMKRFEVEAKDFWREEKLEDEI